MSDPDVKVIYQCLIAAVHQLPWMQGSYQWDQHNDDDDNDDNFIAIYMYITRHTCNGMRFAPELLHSMLPTIQSFHPYST